MKRFKNILNNLKFKSNIDYKYYHLFNNQKLDLNYNTNNFTINYIIYIVNSDFYNFHDLYLDIVNESITDVFLERLNLSMADKNNFFSMKFNNIFWIKLNKINFLEEDYEGLINFLLINSLDINRIFLENTNLNRNFFLKFQNLKGFNNLGFLNFDNNNISNQGLNSITIFLENNNINLEYLSLINTNISNINKLFDYLLNTDIRILDLSSNNILNKLLLIDFIKSSSSISELYLRNIEFSNMEIENILEIFNKNKTKIYNLRLSLTKDQQKYKNNFNKLENEKNINFDINIIGDSEINIFSTFYIKEINSKEYNLKKLSNEYFYIIDSLNRDSDFKKLIKTKDIYLKDAINLFLFDFNDYEKINYLLNNYNFNYIYIENYYIGNFDFEYFIDSIKKQKNKKYKINLISIELSEYQLNYLINNFPKNIFYIEINLNKIDNKREIYISKMLKNKAFIFENIELYQKIFK